MGTLLGGFLYFFSIFFIVVGVLSVFATDLIRRKFFNKLLQIKDMKKWAPLSAVIGIALLLAAPRNRHALLILIFGILSITKAVMLMVAPEKMEKMKTWWVRASDNAYRIYGVIMILAGSVMLMGMG